MDFNTYIFAHIQSELLTAAANWRNSKYVYKNIPVSAVFALGLEKKTKIWENTCKMSLALQNVK